LHGMHRANLLRKDFEHYSKFGWNETPRNGYLWIVDGERRLITSDDKEQLPKNRKATTKKRVKKIHSGKDDDEDFEVKPQKRRKK